LLREKIPQSPKQNKTKKKKVKMTEPDEESMQSCSTEGSLDLERRHLKQSLYRTAESAPWSDPSDAAVVAVVVEDVEKVGEARRLQTSNPAKAKAKINSIQALKQEVVMDEHTISVDALCQRLATALDNGLSLAEHRARLARDGPNRLSPPKQVPGWVKLLKHLFLRLLRAAVDRCDSLLHRLRLRPDHQR
jgi:hypothetical protein